jgi:predicted phage terminase large subunit-like protein
MTFELNPGQQHARDKVIKSPARYGLIYGGTRSGKTFLFTRTILERAMYAPGSRHLITRQEGIVARTAIVKDTWPKLVETCFPGLKCDWKDELGYYQLSNGSEIWVSGLNDDKALEKALGKEYATIFMNEASENKYAAFTILRTRLAQQVQTMDGTTMRQRFFVDLNPTNRMHWTYRLWRDGTDPEDQTPVDLSQYAWDQINPADNAANLSADFMADLQNLGSRAKKRFWEGEYSTDEASALWRREWFKRVTRDKDGRLPVDLTKVVIAIDPATTATAMSDETGIIAAGLGKDGNAYVLEDGSGRYRPEEWARAAQSLYRIHGADLVIGEVNQGGDMVEHVLRSVNSALPYRAVHASRGKVTRAEPVAALYERGKVFHVGAFPDLEDQCCAITTAHDAKATGWSPDRVDALVWAMTELMPGLAIDTSREIKWVPPRFSYA